MNPMRLRHDRILITGRPGIGKTTLLRKVVERMRPVPMAGFYTAEIRSRGQRLGFELQGLNGRHRTLAHVNISSRHRVGKYGVDAAGFEEFLGTLDLLHPDWDLIVIDEIGKMELLSDRFRGLLRDVLNSEKKLIATIALEGEGFIREIKQRSDVRLVEVTPLNRESLPDALVDKGPCYSRQKS